MPPPLVDAHLRAVEEARKDGIPVDANFGLDKTGIAGTIPDPNEKESSEMFCRDIILIDHSF